jgi:stage III sporulation protein AG
MDRDVVKQKAMGWIKRLGVYKYVLLVIAAGALLLLWPEQETADAVDDTTGAEEENFSVETLEHKLETVLSQIDGAGSVSVMLTVKSGMERVLAQDSSNGDTETVVISTGSGKQEVVLLTQKYPDFQGALVVCEGGDEPQVRLLITQAVAALTGLGTARISVCKGG